MRDVELPETTRPEGYVETFDHTQPHPDTRVVSDEEIAAADGIAVDEPSTADEDSADSSDVVGDGGDAEPSDEPRI